MVLAESAAKLSLGKRRRDDEIRGQWRSCARLSLVGRPFAPKIRLRFRLLADSSGRLICARDGTSRMIMMTVPCGFAFARSPEVSPLPGN